MRTVQTQESPVRDHCRQLSQRDLYSQSRPTNGPQWQQLLMPFWRAVVSVAQVAVGLLWIVCGAVLVVVVAVSSMILGVLCLLLPVVAIAGMVEAVRQLLSAIGLL